MLPENLLSNFAGFQNFKTVPLEKALFSGKTEKVR